MKAERIQLTMKHSDGEPDFVNPITWPNDEHLTGEWITKTLAWINTNGGRVSVIEITAA